MNYISLSNEDIIIYNNIQTKVYKNFIKHHKTYGNSFNINDNEKDDLNIYIISQNYCKKFKYNVCLCYRNFKCIENIKLIYNDYYKCINNKNILYNQNNFNFMKPLSIDNNNNNKLYFLDIREYYRQEYIPYIIHSEFLKYKKYLKIVKIINNRKIHKYILLLKKNSSNITFIKYYFNIFIKKCKDIDKNKNNIYYNELIDIFVPKNTIQTTLIDINVNNEYEKPNNYYLLFTLLLNDYNKIIKDYNNLIMDLI